MQKIVNNISLIGNIGQDVELKIFETGNKKASLSLATTEYYKNGEGELMKNTLWHKVIAYGKNADLMGRALSKGCKVAIEGMITYRNYEDKYGVSRKATEILVSDFKKIADAPIKVKSPTPF